MLLSIIATAPTSPTPIVSHSTASMVVLACPHLKQNGNIIVLSLLHMLLISRSIDLWKTCISFLSWIDKLLFPSFSIFSFLLQLQVSSSVSQIIKELCSSSSYSLHYHHLSFNCIMTEAISSENMTNSIVFSNQNIIQNTKYKTLTLSTPIGINITKNSKMKRSPDESHKKLQEHMEI